MTSSELKNRTKKFALDIINLAALIQNEFKTRAIANQIIRSGTSVAANYRAALRAKSNKDFLYKLKICEEEADETLFWLELLIELNPKDNSQIKALAKESNELLAIFVSSLKTLKKKSE